MGIRSAGLPGLSFSSLDLFHSEERRAARSILSSMSIEEQCASLLLVAYGGTKQCTEQFASRYRALPVGGVLLFAYNIPPSIEGLMDLTDGIRRVGEERGVVPFVAIDHEGGTVLRLKGITTDLPDARELGKAKVSEETIRELYRFTSRQLALLGISMNLAPVVEPLTQETLSVLSRRAFSSDPEHAARLGEIYLQEMQKAGVLGVAKHFPGTGNGDPHEKLPESQAKPSDSADPYTLPFRILQKKGALEALMVSHVLLPREGAREPATLSSSILQKVLRSQWGFEGLVLTDDFRMKSLTQAIDPIEGVVRSIEAGADLVMYLGSEYPRVHQALVNAVREGRIPLRRLNEAVERILMVKVRYGLVRGPSEGKIELSGWDRSKRITEFHQSKKEGDVLLREIFRRQ